MSLWLSQYTIAISHRDQIYNVHEWNGIYMFNITSIYHHKRQNWQVCDKRFSVHFKDPYLKIKIVKTCKISCEWGKEVTYSAHNVCSISWCLTHWGLVTPYGVEDLDQHWFRQWLVAWRHQAITWTNVDLSPVRSCGIHLRTLSWEDLQIPISKARLKSTFLKSDYNLPGANELTHGGQLKLCGDINQRPHWLRWWRHQAISWTNIDLSSIVFRGTRWGQFHR